MTRRHQAKKKRHIAVALAAAAAVSWSAAGLPGWASQEAPKPLAQEQRAVLPLACDSQDSPDKGWYQAVYVHKSEKPARPDAAQHIRQTLWNIDQIFEASAQRFGQKDSRRPRLVQDASCQADVMTLSLPGLPASAPNFAESHKAADAAIAQKGAQLTGEELDRFKRTRILYFFDTDVKLCGVASEPKQASKRAGLGPGTAAVNWPCANESAMSHEMTHTFGVSHCDKRLDQGRDPMCRTQDTTPRCDDVLAALVLDCTKDEFAYFSPRPKPGTPLAQRPDENAANSPYLITDSPAPAVDMTLVSTRTAECLGLGAAEEAVHQPCAADGVQTWRRSIDDQGFLTLQHRDSGTCLAAPSKSRRPAETTVRIETCAPRAQRQQWAMRSSDAAPDEYQLLNRGTGQRLQVPGDASRPGLALQAATGGTAAVFRMEANLPRP
ncbi:RICIN domain-containing protein [Streptomyces sp. NPDC051907]|uniref:RICIN domain-containing protein n=1 Tax=Streptomyces sp. NPDC051907 TaxID=3155284 RepID=UPI003448F517